MCRLRLVILGVFLLASLPAVSAGPLGEDPAVVATPEKAGEADKGSRALPWKMETLYRFVWIRGSNKVGETRFSVHKVRFGGRPALEVRSRRTYDFQRASQRSKSTTTLLPDARPLKFEETLDASTIRKLRAHQELSITFRNGKARVLYEHNSKPEMQSAFEVKVPSDAVLFANQAVEHWALFLPRIPLQASSHTLRVFYPDFREVLSVKFVKTGSETLEIGGKSTKTTAYSFVSAQKRLRGTVWLDAKRRLVQIAFPGASPEKPGLKVLLASE